jgi:16S rRNA (guanine966-N2)-methyltransferase
LFSIVGHDLSDLRVLDAFGGSGLLGLEAWSRGARVTIVEREPAVVSVIRRNVQAFGAEVEVATGDVLRLVGTLGPFDLVLVDPPYRVDPGPVLVALARGPAPRWVLEHDADVLPPDVAGLFRQRTRTYGGTALTVYQRVEGA